MSRTNRAAKGFAAALFQYFIQIMVQIFLAPLILMTAGKETLGAYAALTQILGLMLTVHILGSWSLDRFLAQASALDDGGKRFREIFTTFRSVLLVTNTIVAVMVLILSFYVARLFHLTPEVAKQARYSLYIIAVWMIGSTPFWSYQNALVAKQHIAETNLISTGINVFKSVATLLVVLMGAGLFGLMMAAEVTSALAGFIYWGRFRKLYPHLVSGWGIPDKKLLKEMLSFGGYTAVMSLGSRLFLNSANMLASVTNGAAAASTFYTTQMPALTGYNLLSRLADSSTPAVHELFGRGEMQRLRHVFERLVRLTLLMTFPLAIGVVLFNQDLVTCWVGPKMYAGPLLTDTLAVYVGLSALLGLSVLFSYVFGWVRLLAGIALLQGVANIGAGYYLGKTLGLGGITLALAVLLIPQMVFLLTLVSRRLQLNSVRLLATLVLRAALPLALASAAGLYVHSQVQIALHHFGGLIAETVAFTAVYSLGAYWLMMHKEDQADARRYISAILQTGRKLFGTA